MASFFRRSNAYRILLNTKYAVNSSFIDAPGWYEEVCRSPPPQFYRGEKPKKLVFVEDALRRKVVSRYPELGERLIKAFPSALSWYTHPVDEWVIKQVNLMKTGLSEDEAFGAVEKAYLAKQEFRLIQAYFAKQEAEKHGRKERSDQEDFNELAEEYNAVANQKALQERIDRQERLESIVSIHKRRNESGKLLTAEDVRDFSASDVETYVREHPEDEKYFDMSARLGPMPELPVEDLDLFDMDTDHTDRDAFELFADSGTKALEEPEHADITEDTEKQLIARVLDEEGEYADSDEITAELRRRSEELEEEDELNEFVLEATGDVDPGSLIQFEEMNDVLSALGLEDIEDMSEEEIAERILKRSRAAKPRDQ